MKERWEPASEDPADRLEEAICMVAMQSEAIKGLEAEIELLRRSRGVLWLALSRIIEGSTANPNATVRRLIGMAEDALNDDPAAFIAPKYEFSKRARG